MTDTSRTDPPYQIRHNFAPRIVDDHLSARCIYAGVIDHQALGCPDWWQVQVFT